MTDGRVDVGYIRSVSDFLLDYPYGSHDGGVLVGVHVYERGIHSSDVRSIPHSQSHIDLTALLGMALFAHVAHLRPNSQISVMRVSFGVIVSILTCPFYEERHC